MYSIEVHKRISQILSIFYLIGLWQTEDSSLLYKWFMKIWYTVVFGCYALLLFIGVFTKDNETESMFVAVLVTIILVQNVRLYYIIWKKKEILEVIERLSTHLIKSGKEFEQIYNKIENFTAYVSRFVIMIFACFISTLLIFAIERKLPSNFYCPWNWKENKTVYWLAFSFDACQIMISFVCFLFNTIIWFLMMSCAIKFQVLGNELRHSGLKAYKEIIELMDHHLKLQQATNQFKTLFANLFLIQIATSSFSICGSVYISAFIPIDNPLKRWIYVIILLYNFFDIFVVTHFGNEIKFSSSCLSYCLFASNWINQSKSYNKCNFILMEVLKRPQVLVIGKLYPLDLEIFTSILKLAYSMFNIIQNLK